jgi:hypothetical protein
MSGGAGWSLREALSSTLQMLLSARSRSIAHLDDLEKSHFHAELFLAFLLVHALQLAALQSRWAKGCA